MTPSTYEEFSSISGFGKTDQFGRSGITKDASGNADGDGVLGEVGNYEGVGADDDARPDAHRTGDDRSRSDPDAVSQDGGTRRRHGRTNRDAVSQVAVGAKRGAGVDPDAAVVRHVQPWTDPGVRIEVDVHDQFQSLACDLIRNSQQSPNTAGASK
jgi:hypothetical protein